MRPEVAPHSAMQQSLLAYLSPVFYIGSGYIIFVSPLNLTFLILTAHQMYYAQGKSQVWPNRKTGDRKPRYCMYVKDFEKRQSGINKPHIIYISSAFNVMTPGQGFKCSCAAITATLDTYQCSLQDKTICHQLH